MPSNENDDYRCQNRDVVTLAYGEQHDGGRQT